MKSGRAKFNSVLPKMVSAVLAFWLSGVLIFVCCGTMVTEVSAQDSMPECHKHQTENKSQTVSENKKGETDCCIFKPSKTLSGELQTVKVTKQIQAAAVKPEIPAPVYFIQNSYKSLPVYHSAIRNRGSTYLRNCVFRI